MRTIIYVDGFNLYYGCLKDTSYKWLDLNALFSQLLNKNHDIIEIKYFTAKVKATAKDLDVRQRQATYISALEKYIPHLRVHYGHFTSHETVMQLANNPKKFAKVIKPEEKGSDVNLATHLLNDAWLDKYDCAVLVSNDSDMAEAMRLIRKHHKKKKLGWIIPLGRSQRKPSYILAQYPHFKSQIPASHLQNSQLPNPIPHTNIHKPNEW